MHDSFTHRIHSLVPHTLRLQLGLHWLHSKQTISHMNGLTHSTHTFAHSALHGFKLSTNMGPTLLIHSLHYMDSNSAYMGPTLCIFRLLCSSIYRLKLSTNMGSHTLHTHAPTLHITRIQTLYAWALHFVYMGSYIPHMDSNFPQTWAPTFCIHRYLHPTLHGFKLSAYMDFTIYNNAFSIFTISIFPPLQPYTNPACYLPL